MVSYIEYLKMPSILAVILVGIFLIIQIIGEILEFKGKIVPEFIKIRKYFSRKKRERKEITKWMKWVNDRASVYDNSIVEISNKMDDIVQALKCNTKMTEEMFVQNSRDRIIDFATKVGNKNIVVSREEFNRIFKVYDKYEKFLEEHNLTNGEIDIAINIIRESYEQYMRSHGFVEDIRET